jgi:cytochrome c oxidase subunit 3
LDIVERPNPDVGAANVLLGQVAPHEHTNPAHQHQFDTMEQQYEASTLGMWVFLIQEIMFFGGMFVAYLVYRWKFADTWGLASSTLNVILGAINTAVLIGSSLTMALAVNFAQLGRKVALIACILATMGLGFVFLGIKAVEYHDKYVEHHVPGADFCFEAATPGGCPAEAEEKARKGEHPNPAAGETAIPESVVRAGTTQGEPGTHYEGRQGIGPIPAQGLRERSKAGAELYFSMYFLMTGMHALHMIVGIGIMVWLLRRAMRGEFNSSYYTPIENFGLYWHFVDIVWIYLFPLFYLINQHIGK